MHMCLVLYMSSEQERPIIPWDEKTPRFHVKADDPDSERARIHFSKPHVYYVGSDNGCGCGFRREPDCGVDEPEELASKRDNHERLHAFVRTCLADEEFIELFSCWSGDEAEPLQSRRDVALADLIATDFYFSERQLTRVFG
jgi:hypothetical protein